MTVTRTVQAAQIPGLVGGTLQLKVLSGTISLDETRVPYGKAELTVALPAEAMLEQITPYAALRLQVTIDHEWISPTRAAQHRTFDLLLHEREINHDGTLQITAETDEAMLIDYRLTSATAERTYGLSVKAAVAYALGKVGATLEAGAADANLQSEILEPVLTNLIKNPTGATAATWWTTGTNAAGGIGTIAAAVPGVSHQGKAIRCTMAAAEAYGLYLNGNPTSAAAINLANIPLVTPSKKYTLSMYVRASVAKTLRISPRTLNAAGSILTTTVGTLTPLAAGVWTRLSVPFTADATAYGIVAFAEVTVNWAAGDTLDIAGAMLTEGDLVDYFDGATADTGLYDYAWSGTANQSTSTKTNLPNSNATIWTPGKSADDYLSPILTASGLRVFCDEQRKWRLVDTDDYVLEGLVSVAAGYNAKSGRDLMSRQFSEDGRPLWFDHVIVRYYWTDDKRVQQEVFDIAVAGHVKGHFVEINRPFPGYGAAAGMLARAQGRGRTQDLVALTDYLATPGMSIVTTLEGTPVQSGVLSAVSWSWDEDTDDMRVKSRGLTETPADAWVLVVGDWNAATGTWNSGT